MTSRGTRYWDSGAVPLIAPDILGDIISTLADLAIVISGSGEVLSVLANPAHRSYEDLSGWERHDIRTFLTGESIPKFDRALTQYRDPDVKNRSFELNHVDTQNNWEFPISYTLHSIGPDDTILMLGRDMRPVAEMQQQLIKAQLALERDYESQREYDTRFQVLLSHTTNAIVFITVSDGRITEMNNSAARMLGKSRDNLIGKQLTQELKIGSRAELLKRLTTSAQADGHGTVIIESARTDQQIRIVPAIFRAAGERLLLCRLEPVSGGSVIDDRYTRNLIALFENGADGVVMTDPTGLITSANESFLNLVDATDGQSVRGKLLSDYLARGALDQKAMMEQASRVGHMRLYSTQVNGEYGGQRPVTMSATYLNDGNAPCYAFVLRDAVVSELVRKTGLMPTTEEDAKPLMELVGSASLKDIVAQTTDVVEKMCIETAIELTGNNRVAAADMLGLSRQSLYVKLRKYGLLQRES